jgi:hypothetical protein
MRCRTARRWITRDLAGELTHARVERLAQHIERCEGCRREQVAYAALDRALGTLPMMTAMPSRLEQDTLRRVRLAAEEDEVRDARRIGRWVVVTAPALVATAALVLTLRTVPPPVDPDRDEPAAVGEGGAVPTPAARLARRDAPPAPPQPGARRRRAVDTVPSDPPADLAARPDLFVNLPLLRNFEKLEHYDAIETTTVDRPEEVHSNG